MEKHLDRAPWYPGVLLPGVVVGQPYIWRREALEYEIDQAVAGNRQHYSLDHLMRLNAALNTIEDVDHILGELTRGTA